LINKHFHHGDTECTEKETKGNEKKVTNGFTWTFTTGMLF